MNTPMQRRLMQMANVGNGGCQPTIGPDCTAPLCQAWHTWWSTAEFVVQSVDVHYAGAMESSGIVSPQKTMLVPAEPDAGVTDFSVATTAIARGIAITWSSDPLAAFAGCVIAVSIANAAKYLNPVLATRQIVGWTTCREGRLLLPFISDPAKSTDITLVHAQLTAGTTTVSVDIGPGGVPFIFSAASFSHEDWCRYCPTDPRGLAGVYR